MFHCLTISQSALCHVAAADWSPAKEELGAILAEDPNDYEAINNLVVCLIYLGELNQAIAVMEDLISKSKDQAHGLIETAVFNLCTLYELRSDTALEQKIWKLQQLHPYVGDAFHVESFKI
jgi:trafficking protein particle complex subunit 12